MQNGLEFDTVFIHGITIRNESQKKKHDSQGPIVADEVTQMACKVHTYQQDSALHDTAISLTHQ